MSNEPTFKDAVSYGRTRLERLVISILYKLEQATIDYLQEYTGENKLTLYPTLQNLQKRDVISTKDNEYSLAV